MVMIRNIEYKHCMTKYYNSRVKPHYFLLEDFVLKKVILATKDSHKGKLGPNGKGCIL